MIVFDIDAPIEEPASPPSERVIAGDPQATVRVDYESADGRFQAGVWRCTPGRWRIAYDEEEYCRILSGKGAVIDPSGAVRAIGPGDEFAIPAGFTGEWQVDETMTKTWVIALP